MVPLSRPINSGQTVPLILIIDRQFLLIYPVLTVIKRETFVVSKNIKKFSLSINHTRKYSVFIYRVTMFLEEFPVLYKYSFLQVFPGVNRSLKTSYCNIVEVSKNYVFQERQTEKRVEITV